MPAYGHNGLVRYPVVASRDNRPGWHHLPDRHHLQAMPLPIKRLLRSVRGLSAPLMLAAARGRRRPVRWLLPALGIALAVAFAAGVAAEAQIAGDLSARSVLEATSPLDSEVRVTWQGAVSPGVAD